MTAPNAELSAIALVCTLKPSPSESSSELLARQVLEQLQTHGVRGSVIRVADHNVLPGVERDMGKGDEWPGILERVLAADILVLATPVWMGQMSSIAKRVLERLDAELSEADDAGRPVLWGKVAVAAIVGNEDGAHAISADLFQGLNDVGFTIPAQCATYWVGEAMGSVDYKDLDETPEKVASTTASLASCAAHCAQLLKANPYPPAS
jgi:multimeric flavodoxin WrbA